MSVVVLVLAIVGGVGIIQAAVWVPLVHSWRKRSARFLADLDAQTAASGERVLIGPEKGIYRGGSGPYGTVRGNGTIILTDRRVVFRKLSGGMVEVPTAKVVAIRQAASFQSSRVAGRTHLVLVTTDPAEVGFFVDDLAAWTEALTAVCSA